MVREARWSRSRSRSGCGSGVKSEARRSRAKRGSTGKVGGCAVVEAAFRAVEVVRHGEVVPSQWRSTAESACGAAIAPGCSGTAPLRHCSVTASRMHDDAVS